VTQKTYVRFKAYSEELEGLVFKTITFKSEAIAQKFAEKVKGTVIKF
jgi:hypothetical protein